jgi:hypothetical protein
MLALSAGLPILGERRSGAPPAGYTVGVPQTGAAGISKTTGQIMGRQRLVDQQPRRPNREMPEHKVDRSSLPQDPASPQGAARPSLSSRSQITGPKTPQIPGTSFTGATLADTSAFPPDSMGTVGPTQFVVFVNGRIRTFNKSTGVADGVLDANPDVFFAAVMTPVTPPVIENFTSDPQVRYDRLSDRWFLTIIDVPCTDFSCSSTAANRLLLAVSDAASAGTITGSSVWTFFFFQADATNFLDYPSLGIDVNALYIGGNMFNPAGTSFLGTNGYVVRKSSVLGTGPLVVTKFVNLATGSGEGPYSPRGVDNYNPTSNEGYFIGVSNTAFGRLDMRRVATPGGTPSISANILITVNATSRPIDVDHLGNTGGSSGKLDALDDRLFAAHVRSGRLWTAHNIGVTAAGVAGGTTGSSGTKRDASRWYELNVPIGSGTPTVVQSGTIFDNAATVATAHQYWIPSVMVSGQGHAALGFSAAGKPFRINAATVGRLSGDTLGTTETIAFYTVSSTAYNPGTNRWGDYSFTSLDPLDDMTMWTIQEFCDSTDSYGVRVVKLIAPLPATPSSTDHPGGVSAGLSSVSVVVTGTSVSGSGFYDPGTNLAAPALPFNHITATVSGGVTVNGVTYNNPTSVTLDLNTTGASTGLKNITVCNPDAQCKTGVNLINITSGGGATATPTSTPTKTSTPTRTSTPTPTPIPSGFDYFTVVPCRIVDTRGPNGSLGGPALNAGANRNFTITNACGVPSTATALEVNVTVTQPTAGGSLTIFTAGSANPMTATIDYSAGQTRANNAIIVPNVPGAITVNCNQSSGTVHFILDVNGYFQ